MKRKALGKGLGALIPEIKSDESTIKILDLPVDKISPGRFQPRTVFNENSLSELAVSIKERGVIQPIIVTKKRDGYELIAGERRWRAAKSIGYKKIPSIVRIVRDSDALELSLIENIQRENLNPIEEALAYKRLMNEFAFTQDALAEKIGKNRSTLANMLRLLKLPDSIKDDLADGRLTMGHARSILALDSKEDQLSLRKEILSVGMNVRQTESRVRAGLRGKKKRSKRMESVHIRQCAENLERKLGAKVMINSGAKGGKITIHFNDEDELSLIIEKLS